MNIITLIKKFDPSRNSKHDFIFMQLGFFTLTSIFISILLKYWFGLPATGISLIAVLLCINMTFRNIQRYREKKYKDDCWNI